MFHPWNRSLATFFGFIGFLLTFGSTELPAEIRYSLGATAPLLDAGYYAGEDRNGSGPAFERSAFFGNVSNDQKTVAFLAVSTSPEGPIDPDIAIFLVDIGFPDSWRRLTPNLDNISPNAPIYWSPDNQYLFFSRYRISVQTGELEFFFFNDENNRSNDGSTTRLPENNWLLTLFRSPEPGAVEQIAAVPILLDGSTDNSRDLVVVTNFPNGVKPDWPSVSWDASAVAFAHFDGVGNVNLGTPDSGDVYIVKNLQEILQAEPIPGTKISSQAPTSATDSNVVPVRTYEEDPDNFAHVPLFSQSTQSLFFTEDWNDKFTDAAFFDSLALADFDVMVSDWLAITGPSTSEFQISQPGNQFITGITPGGARVLYLSGSGTGLNLFISTINAYTSIDGIASGSNGVVTTATQTAIDPSGTDILIPMGTTINFPEGATKEIVISTPIDPVTAPQLPPGAEGIALVRDFGPDGTMFDPAITVTITYTDDEVSGFDESDLQVFLYNVGTGVFDIEVTDIVDRDLANNKIVFLASHFSTFALASVPPPPLPTETQTPSATITLIPTESQTSTSTPTETPSPTNTDTPIPTQTVVSTSTGIPDEPQTPTSTFTVTPTPTITQTSTAAATETATTTPTTSPPPTLTITETPTLTATVTVTIAESATQTQTPRITVTVTATETQTSTVTVVETPTLTATTVPLNVEELLEAISFVKSGILDVETFLMRIRYWKFH